jgi:DNA-binding NarL/FixJ family response regulator
VDNGTTPSLALPTPASSASIRVGLVADQTASRHRIVEALRSDAGLVMLLDGHSGHAPEPDVVVAALEAPTGQAAPAVRRIAESLVEGSLVLVSPDADTRTVRKALTAGASGVVLEDEIETALVSAVHAVSAGYVFVPRSHGRAALRPELSHRERQVLRLAALGRTNFEIALELCLAESTVKAHLSAAFKELGVCSRREAAALVLDPNEGLYPHVFGPIPP